MTKLICPNCKKVIDSIDLLRYYGHEMTHGVITEDDYRMLVKELKKPYPRISCECSSGFRENILEVLE